MVKRIGKYYIKLTSNGLLRQELEMLKYLDGKLNVPRVVIALSCGRLGLLVTEAMDGMNFRQYLPYVTPEAAVRIYADAYILFHKHHVTHGDFCPMNIMVKDGAVIGFVDFEKSSPFETDTDLDEVRFILTKHYGAQYYELFLKQIRDC